MSITIENPEAEALLADLAARTRRSADLVLALLQRERLAREIADGIASDRLLNERTDASPIVAPRSITEILA